MGCSGYNEVALPTVDALVTLFVVTFLEREGPMVRIYARVLAAVLGVIAIAAALVGISRVGLGVGLSVLYLIWAAILAYAGFSGRTSTIIGSVVAAMGLFLLVLGLMVALSMSILRFPYEGRGWEWGLVHAALGGLTMACAVLLPCSDDAGSR
jgi:hypothetical protein